MQNCALQAWSATHPKIPKKKMLYCKFQAQASKIQKNGCNLLTMQTLMAT